MCEKCYQDLNAEFSFSSRICFCSTKHSAFVLSICRSVCPAWSGRSVNIDVQLSISSIFLLRALRSSSYLAETFEGVIERDERVGRGGGRAADGGGGRTDDGGGRTGTVGPAVGLTGGGLPAVAAPGGRGVNLAACGLVLGPPCGGRARAASAWRSL
jgi:hypothetical protein